MKLGHLYVLAEKMRKIKLYEFCPRTEEQYKAYRNTLLKKIAYVKQNFNDDPEKNKKELKKLKNKLDCLVSPLEYEASKKVVEEFKQSYGDLIPEDCWNFSDIYTMYEHELYVKLNRE